MSERREVTSALFLFGEFMDRQAYISALESSLLNMLKNAIIKVLVTRLPLLAWGPLSPILSFIVGKILELGMREAKIRIFFLYTDLRTNRQASIYETYALKFYETRSKEDEQKMLESFYNLATLSG